MKKLIVSVFAIAAMVSCTKITDEMDEDGLVEIKMKAGVDAIVSRAAVDGLKADITDVAFARTDVSVSGSAHWTSPSKVEVTKIAASSGEISFASSQYYPTDGSTVYLAGFMPATGATLGEDQVNWTGMDGTQDVMYAAAVSGTKATTTPLAPEFKHKLTQVKFKIVGEAGFETGISVKSITLKGVALPASMALSSGEVTYAADADLSISVATSVAVPVSPAAAADFGEARMIKPGSATLTVDVVAEKGGAEISYSGVNIALTNTGAGVAHTITLTFSKKEVSGKATVDGWTNEDNSGTVQ